MGIFVKSIVVVLFVAAIAWGIDIEWKQIEAQNIALEGHMLIIGPPPRAASTRPTTRRATTRRATTRRSSTRASSRPSIPEDLPIQ